MSYPLFLFRIQSLILKTHTENAYRDSTFRFNGKEWDDETGNFYYGARYYDPKISVWLSVDPLAEDYPSLSPYTFVANNPVVFIDPNGESIWTTLKGWAVMERAFHATLGKDNPFTFDGVEVKFDENADLSGYDETQMEMIEHYKTLIQDEDYDTYVYVVGNDEEFKDENGQTSTLRKRKATGVTVPSSAKEQSIVYLSEDPLVRIDGELRPTSQTLNEQGITSVHEIGGHAYYNQQGITNKTINNTLTTEFEGRMREIYNALYQKNYIRKRPPISH